MSIFGLKAYLEPLNLYKIENTQKHFNSHVIKFLVLLIIVKE
jgi:hypothetical protein